MSMFLCRDLSISNLQMDGMVYGRKNNMRPYVDSWIKALRKDPMRYSGLLLILKRFAIIYIQERNNLLDKLKKIYQLRNLKGE